MEIKILENIINNFTTYCLGYKSKLNTSKKNKTHKSSITKYLLIMKIINKIILVKIIKFNNN